MTWRVDCHKKTHTIVAVEEVGREMEASPLLQAWSPDSLLETGVPLVPGRHFMAPGYARIPFGGSVADIRSLGGRLAGWLASRSAAVS